MIARLIGYLLVPFFTHVFLPDEYGLISLVFVCLGIFNVFYTSGMESAFLKLASKVTPSTFSEVYRTILLSLVANISLLSLLLLLTQSYWRNWFGILETPNIVLYLMIGILSTDALSVCGFAALRLKRRSYLFAGLKLSQVVLNAALTIYLVQYTTWGISGVFIANFVVSFTAFVIINSIHLEHLFGKWNFKILKQALQFGLPFIPAGLAHLVNESFDRFFLLRMDSTQIEALYASNWSAEDIVGIYSACYKLAVFSLLLVQMFRMAWQPFFLEHADDEDAPQLFAGIFLLFNALLVSTWLGISLFNAEIAAISIPFTEATLIGKAYWGGLAVVPILLAAYIFQGWYVVFTSAIFISGKTKILAQITAIGALITLTGNSLFTAEYGMQAAAWTTVTSYLFMSLFLWRKGQNHFPIPYPFFKACITFGFAILIFLGYHWIPENWQSNVLKASLLLIFLGGISVVLLKGQSIQKLIKN